MMLGWWRAVMRQQLQQLQQCRLQLQGMWVTLSGRLAVMLLNSVAAVRAGVPWQGLQLLWLLLCWRLSCAPWSVPAGY